MRTRLLLSIALLMALAACQRTIPQGTRWGALYARDGDLWRYDIARGRSERLTEGDGLNWTAAGGDRGQYLAHCAPSISPDGAWLAYGPFARDEAPRLVLQPLAADGAAQAITGTCQAVWAPNSGRLAYAADLDSPWWGPDDSPLYVYDLAEERATPLLPGGSDVKMVGELAWSPDGRSLAYIARLGDGTFALQRVDVATGAVEAIADVDVGVASRPPVCWTAEDRVVAGWQPGARCSRDFSCVGNRCLSHDGARVATLAGADSGALLTVEDADGVVLWQRELAGIGTDRVVWSPDGAALLLDDGAADTPIWRVAGDGSGEAEAVTEEGLLIGTVVVPVW